MKALIEDGVVDINRIVSIRLSVRRVFNNLSEEKAFFALVSDSPFRIKILEKMDNGLLLEAEWIDTETGQLLKKQWFFAKDTKGVRYNDSFDVGYKYSLHGAKILEKANRGFVIETKEGQKVFFSFEEAIKNGLLTENPTDQNYRKLEDLLNYHITIESTNVNSDLLTKNLLEDKTTDVDVGLYSSFYNSEFEVVFLAARSTLKRITVHDLNLPPSTTKESQLTEQNYKANYTAGLDQINEWAAVRRRLQELRANPWITHIEYFANQIPDYIAYIRKGLKNNYSPVFDKGSKQDQLQHLKRLEKEAKKAISEGKVTYEWWLKFNDKLSVVMSGRNPAKSNLGIVNKWDIPKGISHFPLKIMMPTISGEDIGIIAFNRATIEGVYPVGLIDKQEVEVDGREENPIGFFRHDFEHSGFSGNKAYIGYSAGHRLFHKRLLENIEKLPLDERKKAEAVYFIMTHENERQNISDINWTPEKVREEIIKQIRKNTAGLFKFPDDPVEAEKKLEDLADTFMEVYNKAQQHQR